VYLFEEGIAVESQVEMMNMFVILFLEIAGLTLKGQDFVGNIRFKAMG